MTRENKMILIDKVVEKFGVGNNDTVAEMEYLIDMIEKAQTNAQQPQAVICSKNICDYCACTQGNVLCLKSCGGFEFDGRKLTAC